MGRQCEEKEPCVVGPWADWTQCTPSCGSDRYRTRLRTVVKNEDDVACPPSKQKEECGSKKCQECPVSRGEWSDCSCRTNTRVRYIVFVNRRGKCSRRKISKDCSVSILI